MNPHISIVVPVYNTGGFLAETIESVLKQTYTNWELILIDDGSTDDSAEIIKQFACKDQRLHYFHKPNGGQASARNMGISKSKGTYISFLDADDLLVENKLMSQIEELEKYKPDFLYGLGYFYYPHKEEKLVAYDWIYGQMTGEEFFKILYHSCAVNTNTVLVKKTIFDEVGYFDESEIMRGTEDWDLWMRIAKKVNTVYGSPSRNVYYRIHAGGIHLQHTRMLIGKIAIYEKYDRDFTLPKLMRKREYRYIFRELFNHLYKEEKHLDLKVYLLKLSKKDRAGFGTFLQRIIHPITSPKLFNTISNKIIYRIAFRLEKLTYYFFLK